LSDYFVVWQPKDKVGGDYYWIHRCGRGTLVAVIDCTGHGVPGALMTVIAHAALRQIISTIDISRLNPALILQELNGLVKASLTPPENIRHANEGMDVSICLIETHKNLVTFAAAKQDLYYTQGDDVRLIKGNRQSIGYHQSKYLFSYTNHKIDLNSQPTSFYLTTDGWLDQGSEKPPHFPYGKKRFMKSIKDHSHLPMAKQKTAFLSDMEQWQSAEEAYDDITLLGFSVFSRHYIKNQL
jgi:serine phosphatase RsbU (regulator of sigma subunit)